MGVEGYGLGVGDMNGVAVWIAARDMDGGGGYGIVLEMGGRYKRAVGLEIGGFVPFLN